VLATKAAEALAVQRHDERIDAAHRRLKELESKVPTFRLILPSVVSAMPGLLVKLDGVPIGPEIYGDGVIATTPGAHDIEVSAPSKRTLHRRVTASPPGSDATVETATVSLEDEPTQSTPPTGSSEAPPASVPPAPHDIEPENKDGRPQRTIAVVLGGVGILGIGVGTVAGIAALTKHRNLVTNCGGSVSSCNPNSPVDDEAKAGVSRARSLLPAVRELSDARGRRNWPQTLRRVRGAPLRAGIRQAWIATRWLIAWDAARWAIATTVRLAGQAVAGYAARPAAYARAYIAANGHAGRGAIAAAVPWIALARRGVRTFCRRPDLALAYYVAVP
jgi:hypothetical protein